MADPSLNPNGQTETSNDRTNPIPQAALPPNEAHINKSQIETTPKEHEPSTHKSNQTMEAKSSHSMEVPIRTAVSPQQISAETDEKDTKDAEERRIPGKAIVRSLPGSNLKRHCLLTN